MPLDPSIPLAAVGQTVSPFDVYFRMQQANLAQQNAQELAAERKERTAALARDNKTRADTATALQNGGGVRQATLDWATQNKPELVPSLTEFFDKADKSAADVQTAQATAQEAQSKLNDARLNHVGHLADGILQHADSPEMLQAGLSTGLALYKEQFPAEGKDADALAQHAQSMTPDQLKAFLEGQREAAPYYQAIEQKKGEQPAQVVPAGGSLVNGAGNVLYKSDPKPEAITTAQLDQRYQQLRQKAITGGALTPDEAAEVQSYKERKLLGPEAAAVAAANRQARSVDAQTAQQGRAQDFTEKQAGRKDLTEKVEQPYLDAKEKAQTIRDAVGLAQNGNMVAAQAQPLLGVLGLVTTEGVKRINGVELANMQGAGSLLERAKSQLGAWKSGQPMSPKLQSDLVDLAGMLEKGAQQKYLDGFTTITKRYKLDDEKPLVQPTTTQPTTTTGPKVGDVVQVGNKRVKITAIHPDGSFDGPEVK